MTVQPGTYIIAIDGHSSCGKSTLAKSLAEMFNFTYIDSGAMYRAVTYYCLQEGIIKRNKVNQFLLEEKIDDIKIEFVKLPESNNYKTFLNGENVEEEIRKIYISEHVSQVSKIKIVRDKMVDLQKRMAENNSIVMDGRDIGTVVFPDADLKIFMTAEISIRAKRRYKELWEKGQNVSLNEIENNIIERDKIDQSRKISPLRKADDAIMLDNSYLTRQEQLDWARDKASKLLTNN